jgi:nucleotide-binding universal stress UspA family protein
MLKKQDVPCEVRLSVRGLETGEDLVEYAKENQIDQIIIGVRRRSKVGKLVFGSTAQFVILEAPCPVVSVK